MRQLDVITANIVGKCGKKLELMSRLDKAIVKRLIVSELRGNQDDLYIYF
jgi:hypothetical protein